jgi:tetratricopeptide (TPR) repeat protein
MAGLGRRQAGDAMQGGSMRLKANGLGAMVVVLALALAAPEAAAQAMMGRVSVKIVDPDGQPIPDVTITVTSPAMPSFELVKTTSKKGKALLAISDTTQAYEVRLEKAGYLPQQGPLEVMAGGTQEVEWMLRPGGSGEAEAGAEAGGGGGNRAVRTYNEGVEAQNLGDLDTAVAKYREAAAIDPELGAAHTALAVVALVRKDYAGAAVEAEAALAVDPADVRAMQLRFEAYRLAGDTEKAAEAAAALREIGDLGDATARIFNEGVEAFNAKRSGEAMSKFRQVIELDPTNVPAHLALAQISLTQGAPAEAYAMATKALELEPDNTRALKLAFDGARLSGNKAAAGAALDRLVELDPDWLGTTVFEHAAELFNGNEPEAAAFELGYVVKAHPELARAHFMLGVALFNSGRADEGRAHLETFLKLAPEDPDGEVARGLLSYRE